MIRIIPAIDIIGGKCVRLTQGDYLQKKVYNDNPVDVAKAFEGQGFEYLHVVDLDGAKARRIVNYKTLEKIAKNTSLKIDFGGGIKSDEDLDIAFNSGAAQITGGTVAVKNTELFLSWIGKYGAGRVILGADVLDEKIAVSGWQETSNISIFDFLKDYSAQGVQYVICTDIAKDGMLQGSSIGLYRKLRDQFPELKLIASGGVSSVQEIKTLEKVGCEGVIIGKAFYEQKIDFELKNQ